MLHMHAFGNHMACHEHIVPPDGETSSVSEQYCARPKALEEHLRVQAKAVHCSSGRSTAATRSDRWGGRVRTQALLSWCNKDLAGIDRVSAADAK